MTDYRPYLQENGLEGKRLGIWRSRLGFHEEVDTVMIRAFQTLEAAVATLVEVDELIPNINRLYRRGMTVLKYEFKDGLNKYLATHNPATGVKSLADVIDYNLSHHDEAMPYFKMEILEASEECGTIEDEVYLEAVTMIQSMSRAGIDGILDSLNLDAVIAPTGGPAWCTDLINGDNYGGGSSSPAAWAGYPNITVPAGTVNGLPVGLSFFGTAWSEPQLITLAYAFEQQSKARVIPQFLPTLPY